MHYTPVHWAHWKRPQFCLPFHLVTKDAIIFKMTKNQMSWQIHLKWKSVEFSWASHHYFQKNLKFKCLCIPRSQLLLGSRARLVKRHPLSCCASCSLRETWPHEGCQHFISCVHAEISRIYYKAKKALLFCSQCKRIAEYAEPQWAKITLNESPVFPQARF